MASGPAEAAEREASASCARLLCAGALEKVVRLFGYLSDKDIFVEFYRKQLAKRLLLARSVGASAERSMIAKLKLRCGAQFTSKLEGMVTDMNLSSDMQSAFSDYLQNKSEKRQYPVTVRTPSTRAPSERAPRAKKTNSNIGQK